MFVKSVHVALHHLDFASALRTESVAGFELSKTAGWTGGNKQIHYYRLAIQRTATLSLRKLIWELYTSNTCSRNLQLRLNKTCVAAAPTGIAESCFCFLLLFHGMLTHIFLSPKHLCLLFGSSVPPETLLVRRIAFSKWCATQCQRTIISQVGDAFRVY